VTTMSNKLSTRKKRSPNTEKKTAIDPSKALTKKLDILIAITLAREGFQREEVAKVLGVSYKTVERMFAGNWNKIGKTSNETEN
jgi:ribosome-binding protein aMBF1 (putative translation factor)